MNERNLNALVVEHAIVPVCDSCLINLAHPLDLKKRETEREAECAQRETVSDAEATWTRPVVWRNSVDLVLELLERLFRQKGPHDFLVILAEVVEGCSLDKEPTWSKDVAFIGASRHKP